MKYFKTETLTLFLIVVIAACNSKENPTLPVTDMFTVKNEVVTVNPYRSAPLTANISLQTSVKTKISIRVAGKHGAASDLIKEFDDVSTAHTIQVLGLYPGYDNTVELSFKNEAGAEVSKKSYQVKTAALPARFPVIKIDVNKPGQVAEGFTLVSYFGAVTELTPQTAFMFDSFGDIRWYCDFTLSTPLNNLFFDVGIEKLKNGNLYFGDGNTGAIYEMDFMGRVINTWPFPGYYFHHNVQEKPNGNFLVTVSKEGISTVEDFIIEIDRTTKQIINTWDLKAALQYSRQTLNDDPVDWIHTNAVIYDESDNTIIISGRTQAVVKLDQNNNVVWVMGNHAGWGTAGNGADLNNFLLQPLDKNNNPITDAQVLNGNINHPDFEWNWYQHAPKLMPNGHIILFDNGTNKRNFGNSTLYSRAVEFEINTAGKTVKQIWQYGKERGPATFSNIVSDADFLSASNHVIFSPGSVNNATNYGKVAEVDYATKDVVFEATITAPTAWYGITFHRTERMKLYE